MLFIPNPEHSRPRPKAEDQGQRIPRPRPTNLALRPMSKINIPGKDLAYAKQICYIE